MFQLSGNLWRTNYWGKWRMHSWGHQSCVLCILGLPENLLKKRPAVLHLALLLRDAGSQGGVEIRNLGHAHIKHLPHTGL